MLRRRAALRSMLWLSPAWLAGCKAVFGISGGGLAVDCGAVYWTVSMTGAAQPTGQLFRAAKGP